jgi:molybdate transport system substrate-binding protein
VPATGLRNTDKAAEMKLLCSNALRAVLSELAPSFEHDTGAQLAITFASTAMLIERIGWGDDGDLTILTAEAIDDLIRQGKLAAGSRVDLARSAIGIAVQAGARKPDIGSAASFKQALLDAKSIAYSKTGVSGIYFPALLDRLGIAGVVAPKIVMPETGVPIGEVVAKGGAEIGVQQISELRPVPGIDVVGPLPPQLQKVTVFSAGRFATAADPQGAKSLVKALTDAAARPLYVKKGMEPAF